MNELIAQRSSIAQRNNLSLQPLGYTKQNRHYRPQHPHRLRQKSKLAAGWQQGLASHEYAKEHLSRNAHDKHPRSTMQGAVHPAELLPCCDRVVAAQLTSQATVFLAAYYNATRGSAQINAGLHPLEWTQFRSALADYDK